MVLPFFVFIFSSWLQVAPKKTTKSRSLYAKATDTGIDPKVAAKRLNVDWDSAAEIEAADTTDDTEVPKAVVCFYLRMLMLKSSYSHKML